MSDGKRHFKTSVRRQTLIRPNKGRKKIWLFLMHGGGPVAVVLLLAICSLQINVSTIKEKHTRGSRRDAS